MIPKIIIKMQHWQVFLALFIFPIIISVSIFLIFGNRLANNVSYLPILIQKILSLTTFSINLTMLNFIIWMLSVIATLKRPNDSGRKTMGLEILMGIMIMIFITGSTLGALGIMMFHLIPQPWHVFVFVVLGSATVLSLVRLGWKFLYSLRFEELGRAPSINDLDKEIGLLCGLPYGIWFLQPRINKVGFNIQGTSTPTPKKAP